MFFLLGYSPILSMVLPRLESVELRSIVNMSTIVHRVNNLICQILMILACVLGKLTSECFQKLNYMPMLFFICAMEHIIVLFKTQIYVFLVTEL